MKIPRGYSHPVQIGKGSFSTVYRAQQQKLERMVALKVLPFRRAEPVAKVEREARVLSAVNIPCVPRIFDVMRHGTTVVIVMEWIYGIPLSQFMTSDLSETAKYAVAAALIHTLALLHERNIAHRDLKPENIIVTPDRGLVLVDFGFSSHGPKGLPTTADTLQGTPAYMAPELWTKQQPTDFRKADLYSLGVVLQRLFGRKVPDIATALLQDDPQLRPVDCASFERCWLERFPRIDTLQLHEEVANAAADYTAKLLFNGARHLYGNNRKAEAYALLVESLDIWPDNSEALDFMQHRFSSPIPGGRQRELLFGSIVAAAALTALWTAYILGVRSGAPEEGAGAVYNHAEDERRLSLLTAARDLRARPEIPAVLRGITAGGELSGAVTVLKPEGRGTLLVDGQPVVTNETGLLKRPLSAGTHRIDWIDSVSGGRYGETVDVLPFKLQTISLWRFVNDR